jgi:hypothetical protein
MSDATGQRDRPVMGPAIAVAISFLLCAALPLRSSLPWAALGNYTDHVRQSSLAYLAATRGIEVYRTAYGVLAADSGYRQKILEWPQVKCIYPPGALVLFMPLAALGQWIPMRPELFHRVCSLYVLALTHLALWAVLGRLLLLGTVWRIPAIVLTWIAFARAGLSGQYEPVWMGAAAFMLAALEQRRPAAAFGWLALAVQLHYRAVVVVPFGIAAAACIARTRPVGRWPWRWGLVALASGTLSLLCFWMAIDSTAAYRSEPPLLAYPNDALFGVVILATVLGTLAALASGDLALVSCVLGISLISLIDSQHWWHASAVFAPLLARDALRVWTRPALVVAGLTLWAFLLQYAWHARPHALFVQLLQAAT